MVTLHFVFFSKLPRCSCWETPRPGGVDLGERWTRYWGEDYLQVKNIYIILKVNHMCFPTMQMIFILSSFCLTFLNSPCLQMTHFFILSCLSILELHEQCKILCILTALSKQKLESYVTVLWSVWYWYFFLCKNDDDKDKKKRHLCPTFCLTESCWRQPVVLLTLSRVMVSKKGTEWPFTCQCHHWQSQPC